MMQDVPSLFPVPDIVLCEHAVLHWARESAILWTFNAELAFYFIPENSKFCSKLQKSKSKEWLQMLLNNATRNCSCSSPTAQLLHENTLGSCIDIK